MTKYQAVGIGNAVVDVISQCDDAFLSRMGIEKGIMQLIEQDRGEFLYDNMETLAKGGRVQTIDEEGNKQLLDEEGQKAKLEKFKTQYCSETLGNICKQTTFLSWPTPSA